MEEKVGWIETELSQISEIIMGQSPPSSTYNENGIGLPFFQGKAEFTELHPIVSKWCSEPNKIAEPNDILISVRAPVGATNIANQKCCIGRGLAAIRYPQCTKYVFCFLRLIEKELDKKGTGTTFKAISGTILKSEIIPLPPLPEQRAIVSKIEQLFSELDNGIANLRLAQEQLKVYRQAVLKKAFEGELTRKWREQQTDLPDARDLLEQIRKEREEASKVSGKKVKPVKPLTEDEITKLPGLPEGWRWVKIGEVLEIFVGSTPSRKEPKFWGGDIPWVSSGEVAFCKINSTKEFITKLGLENSSTQIHPIGTVMLGMIGEGKTRGQVAILNINACHNQNTAAIRIGSNYLSEFVYHLFEKNYNETRRIGSGNNQQALNKNIIENISIPLCSLPEQHAIVEEIETRLSVCDKMVQDIDEALEKAEALRQSILKKAFEGKLLNERELAEVRMAEDWEPAEVLLERVRAERTGNGKK